MLILSLRSGIGLPHLVFSSALGAENCLFTAGAKLVTWIYLLRFAARSHGTPHDGGGGEGGGGGGLEEVAVASIDFTLTFGVYNF